jgi:hypothetical protein
VAFWTRKRAAQGGRLTLHIGIHRTGTTGLQRALAANRDALIAQGASYPFKGANHQRFAWELHRDKMSGRELAKKLSRQASEPHIILSAEDFCIHRDLGWLAPLQEAYKIDVVVYLRRQDHWLMSWYNQHVKWPFSRRHSVMSPQEFLGCLHEFYWLDFDTMLGRWAEVLGEDSIRVRAMEKDQVTDTIGDFLAAVGLDASKLEIPPKPQNDSLPTEMLEYARTAGMLDLKNPERMAVINFLQAAAKSAGCSAKTLYTATERQAILDRYAASNSAVARRWFGRDALFLEGPPDDDGLYVEGTLAAASSSHDEMLRQTVAALSKQ